ncbi:baculoviral IAP repeat-containing protein 7-like [Mercenaria mercenaria]|uniref:baculoviral IAP repeat-containing protein 7-like n=1 Tax=Mercenaria mercenaria TaxID=6596 RepID=UPI001E1E22CD|nr:baculoviral IAP repeat-containing protein 7-like [Mercenaria mercenaria]XP_045189657.1 baculoviral IAP repeat-containing protein 7-like [Mercenaria mercenaria]
MMHPPGHIKRNNRNKNEYLRYCGSKELKAVSPRPEHSTTVAADVIYCVCPVDKPTYSNPLFPSSENNTVKESKPVQASDHETDTLDSAVIAINISTHYKPAYGTNLQNLNQPYRSALSSDISTSSPPLNVCTSSQSQNVSERRHSTFNGSSQVALNSSTYVPKPPRYPDNASLVNRMSTFQYRLWDVNNKPDIRTLTEYGFFYTGNGDLVRCFQCGIGLKDWVKDDDVLAEHIKYSSDCDFLRQKIGRTETERLKNSLFVHEQASSSKQTSSNSYKIRSPRYQTMGARLTSFDSFPRHILIQPRTLAVAGLYYTGKGDLCRCFACDGGLKDWSTGDDPIQEHATYFPNCPYINQLKGQEYVNQMQSRKTNSSFTGTSGNETTSQEKVQGGASSQASNHAGIEQGAMSQVSQSFATLSMDKLSVENNASSVLSSQVFQQLGYTELDVNTARAELHRKGNIDPTSEDIVNTILDLQERTSRQTEGATGNGNKSELQEMLEENERLSEIVHCKLCVTGEPDILFLPCAHHKICRICAENLTHCPVCHTQIKEKVKTYRA